MCVSQWVRKSRKVCGAFVCVDTKVVTEGDLCVSGLLCPLYLPVLAVSVTVWLCQLDSVTSDGVFLLLKPSWTKRQQELCNRLGDRFSKQPSHEYASFSTNSQEKKLLDVAESENKQFCHIRAAALTLSAYFSESLTVSSILFLQPELEERVSCLFHH